MSIVSKRPLLFGAIVFLFGIMLAVYGADISVFSIGAVLILSAVLLFRPRKTLLCALTILIMLAGWGRMELAESRRDIIASKFSGKTSHMQMTITDFPENNRVIARFADGNRKYKAYLSVEEDIPLSPGDIVEGEISLRAPLRSKVSGSDFAAYLQSRGVYLLASAETVSIAGRDSRGINGAIYGLRSYMDRVGQRFFSSAPRAFFNAMVFGDKRHISDKLGDALQGSGLNHIAVVSGMHLSVIIAVQMFFLRKLFGKGKLGNLLAIPCAIFITLATGAGASVVRALIMCSIYQLSQLCCRDNDVLTSLGATWTGMLLFNPFLIFNAGFVLSVLSVLGIVLFYKKVYAAFSAVLPKSINEAASLSVSAQLAVTPALVYYFGTITLYAVLSNILVFSVSTIYVVVGMVLILISPVTQLSCGIAQVMKLMSDFMEWVCYRVSSLPGAMLQAVPPDGVFLCSWMLVLVLIYIYPVGIKKLIPIAGCFAAAIVLCSVFSYGNTSEISFYSYGNETMTAISHGGDGGILIDCPDSFDANTLEKNSGIPFTSCVLTTNAWEETMKKDSGWKLLIASEELFSEEEAQKLLKTAEKAGTRVIFAQDSQRIGLGNTTVEYLPLEGEYQGKAVRTETDGKVMVTLQGMSEKEAEALIRQGKTFGCDYVRLPFMAEPGNFLQTKKQPAKTPA